MLCCYINNIREILLSSFELATASWINAVITIVGIAGAIKLISNHLGKRKLKAKRDQKRKEYANAIGVLEQRIKTNRLVSDDQVTAITGYNLATLLSKLKKGELKPTQVLQAYQIKALEVHKKTNCLVTPILSAEQWARDLESSSERGLLYGLPISLKENFGLEGYDSTGGCADYIDKIFKEDAVLVQVMKKHGAIPFVRTNIPQTMFSWETSNPIFGATVNFHDVTRGVGGSSGGEACLVSGGGSILGLGSDAGGSIRIPSGLCGVYGFKPTSSRLSSVGTHPILKGENLVNTSYGPIGRDVSCLVTAFRALTDPMLFDMDATVPRMPFAEEVFNDKRRLRIGYYVDDGFLTPVPAMREGVLTAINALKAAGHEVVPWKHKDFGHKNMAYFTGAVFGDQGQELKDVLRYDEVDKYAMKSTMLLLSLPLWLKWLVRPIIYLVEPRMLGMLKKLLCMRNITAWWKLNTEFIKFRQDVITEWKKAGLDVVICPGFACPAMPLGLADTISGAITYTNLYNVLNFPAGTMPVRKVTQSDVDSMKDYKIRGLWEKQIKKGMVGSVGLPVNVQVISLPWQEELCLRVMAELEGCLKTTP